MVGGKPIGTSALIGGLTGGALAGVNAGAGAPTTTPSDPIGAGPTGVSASMEAPSPLSGLGDKLGSMSGTQVMQNVGILGAGAMGEHALNQKPATPTDVNPKLAAGLPAAMSPSDVYSGPISGIGRIGMASGGQVPIKEGAYVIPADVVSALGNGSSKAGAEFLYRLMDEVKNEATKRQGLGAVAHAEA